MGRVLKTAAKYFAIFYVTQAAVGVIAGVVFALHFKGLI